jgi:hypothetical protein
VTNITVERHAKDLDEYLEFDKDLLKDEHLVLRLVQDE